MAEVLRGFEEEDDEIFEGSQGEGVSISLGDEPNLDMDSVVDAVDAISDNAVTRTPQDWPGSDDMERLEQVASENPRSLQPIYAQQDSVSGDVTYVTRFFDVRSGREVTAEVDMATRKISETSFGVARWHNKPPETLVDRMEPSRTTSYQLKDVILNMLGLTEENMHELSLWNIVDAGVNSTAADKDLQAYLTATLGKLDAVTAVMDQVQYPEIPDLDTPELRKLRADFRAMMEERAADSQSFVVRAYAQNPDPAVRDRLYNSQAVYSDRTRQVRLMTYGQLLGVQAQLLTLCAQRDVSSELERDVRTLFVEDLDGETPFRLRYEGDAVSGDGEWRQTDMGPYQVSTPNGNAERIARLEERIAELTQRLNPDIPSYEEVELDAQRAELERLLDGGKLLDGGRILLLTNQLRQIEVRLEVLRVARTNLPGAVDAALFARNQKGSEIQSLLFEMRLEVEDMENEEDLQSVRDIIARTVSDIRDQPAQPPADDLEYVEWAEEWLDRFDRTRLEYEELNEQFLRLQRDGWSGRPSEVREFAQELDAAREERDRLLEQGRYSRTWTHVHSVNAAQSRGPRLPVGVQDAPPVGPDGVYDPSASVPANLLGMDPVNNWGLVPVEGPSGYSGLSDPSLLQWECCGQTGVQSPGCWVGLPDPKQTKPVMTQFVDRLTFPNIAGVREGVMTENGLEQVWLAGLQLGDAFCPPGAPRTPTAHLKDWASLKSIQRGLSADMARLGWQYATAASAADLELPTPVLMKLKLMYGIVERMNNGFNQRVVQRAPRAAADDQTWTQFIWDDIFGMKVTRCYNDLEEDPTYETCTIAGTDGVARFSFNRLPENTPLRRRDLDRFWRQYDAFRAAIRVDVDPDNPPEDIEDPRVFSVMLRLLDYVGTELKQQVGNAMDNLIAIPGAHPDSVARSDELAEIEALLARLEMDNLRLNAAEASISDEDTDRVVRWLRNWQDTQNTMQTATTESAAKMAAFYNEMLVDGLACGVVDMVTKLSYEEAEKTYEVVQQLAEWLQNNFEGVEAEYSGFIREMLDRYAGDDGVGVLLQAILDEQDSNPNRFPAPAGGGGGRDDDIEEADSTVIDESSSASEVRSALREQLDEEERPRGTQFTTGTTTFTLPDGSIVTTMIPAAFRAGAGNAADMGAMIMAIGAGVRGESGDGAKKKKKKKPALQGSYRSPNSPQPAGADLARLPKRQNPSKVCASRAARTSRLKGREAILAGSRRIKSSSSSARRERVAAAPVPGFADESTDDDNVPPPPPQKDLSQVTTAKLVQEDRVVYDKERTVMQLLDELRKYFVMIADSEQEGQLELNEEYTFGIYDAKLVTRGAEVLPRFSGDDDATAGKYAVDTPALVGASEVNDFGKGLYNGFSLLQVIRLLVDGEADNVPPEIRGAVTPLRITEQDAKRYPKRYSAWKSIVYPEGRKAGVFDDNGRVVTNWGYMGLTAADGMRTSNQTLQLGNTVSGEGRKFRAYRLVQAARNWGNFIQALQLMTRPQLPSNLKTVGDIRAYLVKRQVPYQYNSGDGLQESVEADAAEKRRLAAEAKERARLNKAVAADRRRYKALGPPAGATTDDDDTAGLRPIVPRLVPVLVAFGDGISNVGITDTPVADVIFPPNSAFVRAVQASGIYTEDAYLNTLRTRGMSAGDGFKTSLKAISSIRGALRGSKVYDPIRVPFENALVNTKLMDTRGMLARNAVVRTGGRAGSSAYYDNFDESRAGAIRIPPLETVEGVNRDYAPGTIRYGHLIGDIGALLALTSERAPGAEGLAAVGDQMGTAADNLSVRFQDDMTRIWQEARRAQEEVKRQKAQQYAGVQLLDLSESPLRYVLARCVRRARSFQAAKARKVYTALFGGKLSKKSAEKLAVAILEAGQCLKVVEQQIYPELLDEQKQLVNQVAQKLLVIDRPGAKWRTNFEINSGRKDNPVSPTTVFLRSPRELVRLGVYLEILHSMLHGMTTGAAPDTWGRWLANVSPGRTVDVHGFASDTRSGTEPSIPSTARSGLLESQVEEVDSSIREKAVVPLGTLAIALANPRKKKSLFQRAGGVLSGLFTSSALWPTMDNFNAIIIKDLRADLKYQYKVASASGDWSYFEDDARLSALARILVDISDPTRVPTEHTYVSKAKKTAEQRKLRVSLRSKDVTTQYTAQKSKFGKTAVAMLERIASLVGLRRPQWARGETQSGGVLNALATAALRTVTSNRPASWITEVVTAPVSAEDDGYNWYVKNEDNVNRLAVSSNAELQNLVIGWDLYMQALLVLGNRTVPMDDVAGVTLLVAPIEGLRNIADVQPEVKSFDSIVDYLAQVPNVQSLNDTRPVRMLPKLRTYVGDVTQQRSVEENWWTRAKGGALVPRETIKQTGRERETAPARRSRSPPPPPTRTQRDEEVVAQKERRRVVRLQKAAAEDQLDRVTQARKEARRPRGAVRFAEDAPLPRSAAARGKEEESEETEEAVPRPTTEEEEEESLDPVDPNGYRGCMQDVIRIVDGLPLAGASAKTTLSRCYESAVAELKRMKPAEQAQFATDFGLDDVMASVESTGAGVQYSAANGVEFIRNSSNGAAGAAVLIFMSAVGLARGILGRGTPPAVAGPRIARITKGDLSDDGSVDWRQYVSAEARDLGYAFKPRAPPAAVVDNDDDTDPTEDLDIPAPTPVVPTVTTTGPSWPREGAPGYQSGVVPEVEVIRFREAVNSLLTDIVQEKYDASHMQAANDWLFGWWDTVATDAESRAMEAPVVASAEVLAPIFQAESVSPKGKVLLPGQNQPRFGPLLANDVNVYKFPAAMANLLIAAWAARGKLSVGADSVGTAVGRAANIMDATSKTGVKTAIGKTGPQGGTTKLYATLAKIVETLGGTVDATVSTNVETYKSRVTVVRALMQAESVTKELYLPVAKMYNEHSGKLTAGFGDMANAFSPDYMRANVINHPKRLAAAMRILMDVSEGMQHDHADLQIMYPGAVDPSAAVVDDDDIASWT